MVYQRSATVCQFTFACDGSTNHPIEPRAWAIATAIARAALAGEVFAPVGSATHYHTTAILPWWASSLARIGVIGSHIFYRWSDRLGGALSFRQAYSGREAGDPTTARPLAIAGGGDGSVSENGVTVHRGATPIEAVSVRTASTIAVSSHMVSSRSVSSPPVLGRPQTSAFGVRIHRFAPTPPTEAPTTVDPAATHG